MIRAGRDGDAAAFIALIGACWAEYPGCVMDVDGEVPELRALASYYHRQGGALWVAEGAGAPDAQGLAGMIGVRPAADEGAGAWEVCKLYVARAARGGGLAHVLLDRAEAHARDAGAAELMLWSDTRFDRAHSFYEKRGFVRGGPIRALHDLSHTLEYRFSKPLCAVAMRQLDAPGAASAVRGLAGVLAACVADGASVGFLPPLAAERAERFWRGVATGVAEGRRVLLAGWHDGRLAGTVQLALDTPDNAPHRAELLKLLVHPAARRAGLGRALVVAAEDAARTAGRTLLTLDTRAGDAAEALYRAGGWTEAGRIPGYALDAAGTAQDTVLFWKRLAPGAA